MPVGSVGLNRCQRRQANGPIRAWIGPKVAKLVPHTGCRSDRLMLPIALSCDFQETHWRHGSHRIGVQIRVQSATPRIRRMRNSTRTEPTEVLPLSDDRYGTSDSCQAHHEPRRCARPARVGARTEREHRPARRCPTARIGWRPGSPRTRRRPPAASSLAGTKRGPSGRPPRPSQRHEPEHSHR